MGLTNLKNLETGQRAKVLKIISKGETKKRIIEMGVTPGVIIEVERVAPLGDPIEVKIRGYHLSLRKIEAEGINVEPIANKL